ncbi:MAG: hypothetical protein J6P73_07345 [Bacteroidales bacterium]|nr:hypothetical protein [Bacteroidales bacterium]
MKPHWLFLFAALILPSSLHCQEGPKHHLFLEALGAAGYGSVNYEYEAISLGAESNRPWHLSLNGGLGTYHFLDYERRFNPDIIVPLGVNVSWGGKHRIKGGVGVIPCLIVMATPNGKQRSLNTSFNLRLGYQYSIITAKGKGLTLGLYYTPMLEYFHYFRHWGGVQIGFLF